MAPGKKKWLFCPKCAKETWAVLLVRFTFTCSQCSNEVDLIASKKVQTKKRKESRVVKQKELGTYKSPNAKKKEKNANRDFEYMAWIKSIKCCVPGCTSSGVSDAHHAILKSKGGSDRTCVPLCHYHHIGEYHGQLGSVDAALKEWGIDLLEVSKDLNIEYDKMTETGDHQKYIYEKN